MGEGVPIPAVLDRETAPAMHAEAVRRLREGAREIRLDLSGVERADAFGAAAILEIHREAAARKARLVVSGASPAIRDLLAFVRMDRVAFEEEKPVRRRGTVERFGEFARRGWADAIRLVALNVDGLWYTFLAPFLGRGPRLGHLAHQVVSIGARSTGIIVMISLFLGVIMALQSANQLRQFGANVFVADMIGIVMTRELGPLMTAVLIAARSGSSIAAELGTMVVTEEVDALRVQAIDPKRFLFAPRYVALAIVLPGLAMMAVLAGILGGFLVGVLALDIGGEVYISHTLDAVLMFDLVSGLVKSFVFANVIAVVSCHMGLSLRGGPEEVGRATTRAVVLSIVLVIAVDVLFTVFFYYLE